MIRCIAAIDTKQGIANENGIPWAGKVPGDVEHVHEMLKKFPSAMVMGYGMYVEMKNPYPGGANIVASSKDEKLRPGFELTKDANAFISKAGESEDVWILGGAMLFASTIDLADELHITQLNQDFNCTKFFPEFKNKFTLKSETEPVTENGISYTFQVWTRK